MSEINKNIDKLIIETESKENYLEEIFIISGVAVLLRDLIKGVIFALGALLVGTFAYIVKVLIQLIIKAITQAIFEIRVKKRFINHIKELESFIDYCNENDIKRSGVVKFTSISTETISCIKKSDHDEAVSCTINIIKQMHFYIMDLFLQVIYFSGNNLKSRLLFDIADVKLENELINSVKTKYITLLTEFFEMINHVKSIRKSLVIDVYALEQEFNENYLSVRSFYENLKYK